MKIAVTYDNGQIFQHFGKTEYFKIFEVNGKAIVDSEIVSSNGNGHGALAKFLANLGVTTLICGGIGGGAQAALSSAGIEFFGGVTGDADSAVNALLCGKLNYVPNVRCGHHSHESHACGSHGCGSHGCHDHNDR